jgi:hypothetical protein
MNDESQGPSGRPPLQFGLRTMFIITAACCVLFATLEWLDVPPIASVIVLVVLGVGSLAAVALVVVIAGSVTGEEEDE